MGLGRSGGGGPALTLHHRLPGAAGALHAGPAVQSGDLPPQPAPQHRLRLAGGEVPGPGVLPRHVWRTGILLYQNAGRLCRAAGQADQTAEGASLPLEGDAGHQLERSSLSGLIGLPQQLMDGIPGDAGSHRAVGQGEHLILSPLLLLPAVLLLILRRPIPVGALLGVLLLLLLGVNQVVVLPGVVFPKDCGGGTLAQAVHGLLHLPL